MERKEGGGEVMDTREQARRLMMEMFPEDISTERMIEIVHQKTRLSYEDIADIFNSLSEDD